MGDPFSVASGAVGIISLGLQVCGELVSYCQAYGNFEDDIQKLGNTAASLQFPLEQLGKLIKETRISNPEIARDLEAKAMLLEGSLRKLQKKLDTCKPVLNDFSGKVRTQMKKAAHLFRRDMLSGLRDDLDAIQQTLLTALTINTVQKMTKLEAMQENALKLLNDLHVSMNQLPTRQLPSPALLQSLCLRQEEHTQLISAAANMELQIKREIKATDVMLPVNQNYAIASRRTRQRYQRKRIEVSFRYSSRLLNFFFSASLSASTGAGGISLAPVLSFQALCAEDSWQFKTIYAFSLLCRSSSSGAKAEEILNDTIHWLQVAFAEGRASPCDMIQLWGNFKAVSLLDLLAQTTRTLKSHSSSRRIFRLINFLGECGSATDNRSTNGVLSAFSCRYCWTEDDDSIVSYLLDLGGPLRGIPSGMIQKRNLQYIVQRDEDGISCPDIIKIILRESVEDLRNALEARHIGPCDKIEGLSLLDYAIGWPQGVETLLAFGANPNSVSFSILRYDQETPDIDSDGVYESIKKLIDAGAITGIENLHRSQMTRWNTLIIKSMAERRKRLWEWACCYIPPERIALFNKDEGTIIDAQVKELYEFFRGLGKPIPPSMKESSGWVSGHSVYHWHFYYRDNSVDIFDELYASGFRDIDAADDYGLTPSMTYCNVKKAAWLASKGANCNRRLPHSNGTVAILWSTCIPNDLTDGFHPWYRFSSTELQRWKKQISGYRPSILMLHAIQDDCLCPCSPGGCTALSAALRYLFQQGEYVPARPDLEKYPNLARHLKGPEFPELSERGSFKWILETLIKIFQAIPEAERIIVRALTFEGLGMKHACCTEVGPWFTSFMMAFGTRGKSDDEVDEILDEEKDRCVKLERLVLEFDTKFLELGLPIWEFLTRHWQPRMIEYLSHRDPYDEEHHKETRKLGVDLEVDDSDVPRWIHFLGDQVEELDDEST